MSFLEIQFIANWVEDPADLRILEALELRAGAQKNVDPKLAGIIKSLKTLGFNQIDKAYQTTPEKLKDTLFYESATLYPDVLDVKVAVDLDKALEKSDFVNKLENKVIDKFVANLPSNLSGVVVN